MIGIIVILLGIIVFLAFSFWFFYGMLKIERDYYKDLCKIERDYSDAIEKILNKELSR